mgnify:CR=1 FL=1
MDPQSAKLVRDAILDLRREQRSVLVCTHNLTEAELLARVEQIKARSGGKTPILATILVGDTQRNAAAFIR